MKEIIIASIAHFSWPLVFIIAIFMLRTPICALLQRVNAFKAGSVELQLQETLSTQNLSEKQIAQINKLTVDELDLFLLASFSENIGFNYQTPMPPETFKRRMQSLENAGLLEILNPDDDGKNIRQNVTETGKHVRSVILNGATKILHNSAAQNA